MNVTDYIKQLKLLLSTVKEVEFAYLFGLFATDTISNHSDIDVKNYRLFWI